MAWLERSVALITGGGSGLGLALIDRFVAEGARVGFVDRDAGRVADVGRKYGDLVEPVVGDVRTWEANAEAVARTVERFGVIDAFVANAGVFDNFQPFHRFDPRTMSDAFDELFAVNVRAGLLGVRAALPELRKSRGSVIFTISNAGFYAGGGGVLYTASKHALVGVVKQLAYELAPEIRVNGVAPGGMRTNLSGLVATGTDQEKMNQVTGLEDMLKSITPLAVAPTPADYCGPYVLLASRDNASPMTGVIINTDGGFGVRGIMNVRGGAGAE